MVPTDFMAACLYQDSFDEIDFDHFIHTITAIVEPDGLQVGVTHRTDGNLLMLKVGTCCIKVDMIRNPCEPAGFANAVNSPFLQMQSTDFAAIIQNNQQYILLSVVSGEGLFNGEHMAMIANMGVDMGIGADETQDEMELRLKLLHMTTLYTCTYAKPDLIHWTQSEQMFTGDSYLSFVDEELPLMVTLQPWITPGDRAGAVTVRFVGSEQMIGTRLMLKSTTLNMPDILQIGMTFVEYCRTIGAVPDDGNTMGREEEWIVQVHNTPATQATPQGVTELTVLSHKNLSDAPTGAIPPRVDGDKQLIEDRALRDAYLNKSSVLSKLSSKLNPFRKK